VFRTVIGIMSQLATLEALIRLHRELCSSLVHLEYELGGFAGSLERGEFVG
jgi:hypothetical protein